MRRATVIATLLVVLLAPDLLAQRPLQPVVVRRHAVVIDGDTIPIVPVEPVVVRGRRRFNSQAAMRRYYRLIYNLKKAYPYAQIAKREMLVLNDTLQHVADSRERKRLIKETEKRLFKQYEGQLKNLTITQGKLIIKLVKRETGNTTYNLVRELKGGFSAGFWQGVARLFGSSLKLDYDPHGEDALMEELVQLIEQGLL
ncbi:MAG: DUF4294 domain-containing protein [Bacteroidales bacterium]|nr:DUF4294 domain-containing protein [Bacteroidales bacterium]